jgi:hypothetical protein
MGEVELCVKAGVGHQTFAKMARRNGAVFLHRQDLHCVRLGAGRNY